MRKPISLEDTYAEMSPETFAALRREELTEEARACYDRELIRRNERTLLNFKADQVKNTEHNRFLSRLVQSGSIVLVRPRPRKRQYYSSFFWRFIAVLVIAGFTFLFLPWKPLSIIFMLCVASMATYYWNRRSCRREWGIRSKEAITISKEGITAQQTNSKISIGSSRILGINIYERSKEDRVDIYYSPESQSKLYSLLSIPYSDWLIESDEIAGRAASLGMIVGEYVIAVLNNRLAQGLPIAMLQPEYEREYNQDRFATDKVAWYGRVLLIKRTEGSILNRQEKFIRIPVYAIKGTHLFTESINYTPSSGRLTLFLDDKIVNDSSIVLNIGGGGDAYQIYLDCVFASSLIYRKFEEVAGSNGRLVPESNGDISQRILCSDGTCIGVINEKGICNACRKPYAGKNMQR